MLTTIISKTINYLKSSSKSEPLDLDAKLIKLWLNEYKYTPNTYTTYRVIILRFYLWINYNSLTFIALTKYHLLSYIDFLKAPDPNWCNIHRHKFSHPDWRPFQKPLSLKSIHRNLTVIKQMFIYLFHNGSILLNPSNFRLRLPSYIKYSKQNRYLTIDEFNMIIEYINNLPDSSPKLSESKMRVLWIFKLLFYTGCRRSEVVKASMIDVIYLDRRLWLQVCGKGNKVGNVPVVKELAIALDQYRDFYELPSMYNLSSLEANIPLIILNKINNQYYTMSASHLWFIVKSTCILASESITDDTALSCKLKLVSPHWLRHSSATAQVDAGINLKVVQKNLRHSCIETTLQYQHVNDDFRHFETITKFKS